MIRTLVICLIVPISSLLPIEAALSKNIYASAAQKAEAAFYCAAVAPTGIAERRLTKLGMTEGRKFFEAVNPSHHEIPESVYRELDTFLFGNVVFREYSHTQSVDFALGAAEAYVNRNSDEEVKRKSEFELKSEDQVRLELYKSQNCELLF